MTDTIYTKFVERWKETMDLPPQTVGPFTPFYKMVTRHLKVMPWPVLVVMSVCVVFGLYMLFGSAVTTIVSLLQKGF